MIPVEANNRIAGVKKDAGGEAIGNRYAGKDAKAGAEEKKGQKIENWILLYNEKIQSGEINACRKIKKVYAKLAADIAAGEEGSAEWFYSEARAQHAIDFIERYCKHSKGKFGGKPVQRRHARLLPEAAQQVAAVDEQRLRHFIQRKLFGTVLFHIGLGCF